MMTRGLKMGVLSTATALGLVMAASAAAQTNSLTIRHYGTVDSKTEFNARGAVQFDPAVQIGAEAVITYVFDVDPDAIDTVDGDYSSFGTTLATASLSIGGQVRYSFTGYGDSILLHSPMYGIPNAHSASVTTDALRTIGLASAVYTDFGHPNWPTRFENAFDFVPTFGESMSSMTIYTPGSANYLQSVYFTTTRVTGSGFATAAAVPEPATWGMMVLGFGVAGYSLRRRSVRAVAA